MEGAGDGGVDRPGAHAVDPDAGRPVLTGQSAGEHHYATLGCTVGGHAGNAADDLNERLAEAVRVGHRRAISTWLDAAFDFWETVRYSAMAQEEAAAIEPEVRRARAESFDRGVGAIMRGLAAPGRGDETSRRVRAVLIYSQLQNVIHRWMRVGWDVDRQEMLQV
jgi:hypothetical protein